MYFLWHYGGLPAFFIADFIFKNLHFQVLFEPVKHLSILNTKTFVKVLSNKSYIPTYFIYIYIPLRLTPKGDNKSTNQLSEP